MTEKEIRALIEWLHSPEQDGAGFVLTAHVNGGASFALVDPSIRFGGLFDNTDDRTVLIPCDSISALCVDWW